MKYLKLFEKYYQDLYHYTSIKSLLNILVSEEIKKSQFYDNVSLTRNSNFFNIDRGGNMQKESNKVRINIDAEKLKNNQKIKPFNYFKRNYNNLGFKPEFDEDEEISNTPINIKYIKSILIYEKNLKDKRYIFLSTEFDKEILQTLSEYYDLETHYDHNKYYLLFNDFEILEVIKIICKKKNITLIII